MRPCVASIKDFRPSAAIAVRTDGDDTSFGGSGQILKDAKDLTEVPVHVDDGAAFRG